MSFRPFVDRVEAGRRLGALLAGRGFDGAGTVVVGLPRGGVPVAFEAARVLHAPLDVIVVRKLGVPYQTELAMGAIGEDGVRVLNHEVLRIANVTAEEFARVEERERAELVRRAQRLRNGRPPVSLRGKTVIVVDDGIATGSTARAACLVARAHGAAKVVLAAPVAPMGWEERMGDAADEYIAFATPEPFYAIGQFYEDFAQTTDDTVAECLAQAPGDATPQRDEEIAIDAGPVRLAGHLTVPPDPRGLVVFAHGSGSSRHSPRNRFVAVVLQRAGLATLLFDLLTPDEELDRANVFDIGMLARRLVQTTEWVRSQPDLAGLPLAYFGASTGAGAALWAAAEPGADIAAVVSRGGRPDLAGPRLADVAAPTLLIVGGRDDMVLELNRDALAQLRCESKLSVIPGATHLFEEPGTLAAAADEARDWLVLHLSRDRQPARG